jgi:hypothetical protein
MTLSSSQVAPAPPGFSVVAARAAGWARVGDTLLLLVLPVATAEGTAISSLRLAGAEIEAPIATCRLVDADGALLLAALRDPARIAAPGTPLSLSDEEGEIAALHLGEEAEAEALCSLLPEAQRSATLQFLARNAAGLFGSEPGLAVLVHRLAMAQAGDAAASPLSRPGRGPLLWSVPQESVGSWLLLEPGRTMLCGGNRSLALSPPRSIMHSRTPQRKPRSAALSNPLV